MKSLKFLMVGLLCLGAIGLANFGHKVKAEGIKPIDPASDTKPGITVCDCTCQSLTISYAGWLTSDDTRKLWVSVNYQTGTNCSVSVKVTATAVYADGSTGPETASGGTDTVGTGPTTGQGTVPRGALPDDGTQVGWDVDVYLIRDCDSAVIGHTSTYVSYP
jgi:hypothetical protein